MRVWEDIGYVARIEQQRDHYVNFVIYELQGIECGTGAVVLHKKGSPSWPDPVYDTSEAEEFITGYVKWDGCSDWLVHDSIHYCSRTGLAEVSQVLQRCWDWAAETMPNFRGT